MTGPSFVRDFLYKAGVKLVKTVIQQSLVTCFTYDLNNVEAFLIDGIIQYFYFDFGQTFLLNGSVM